MKSGSTQIQKERRPRSLWFDPRFAIGLGLVVVSVLGVLALVSNADTSVKVLSARSSLSPGDHIRVNDLLAKSVSLGDAGPKYLLSTDMPSDGVIVTRAISAGELIPASAVGSADSVRVTSVVVNVSGQLPRSVTAGSVVDVWAAEEQADSQLFGPPSVVVSSATVVRVIESDGIVANAATEAVEVLVPRSKTARVLEAIANEDAVSLVPVSLPAKD